MGTAYPKNRKISLNSEDIATFGTAIVDKWYSTTVATLDKIYSRTIGRFVIDNLGNTELKPYTSQYGVENATGLWLPVVSNEIRFSPDAIRNALGPGAAPDEILFHEMIHVLERGASNYKDARDGSFKFDDADFNTINATNVYAAEGGDTKRLRKDHQGFDNLPVPFSNDSGKMFLYFWSNFLKADGNNSKLYGALRNSPAAWNPYWNPVEPDALRVVVKEKNWNWNFYLFPDVPWVGGRAFWEDKMNPAQYGFGKWTQNGAGKRVVWEGANGAWDELPGYGSTDGRTKTGGVIYETKVSKW